MHGGYQANRGQPRPAPSCATPWEIHACRWRPSRVGCVASGGSNRDVSERGVPVEVAHADGASERAAGVGVVELRHHGVRVAAACFDVEVAADGANLEVVPGADRDASSDVGDGELRPVVVLSSEEEAVGETDEVAPVRVDTYGWVAQPYEHARLAFRVEPHVGLEHDVGPARRAREGLMREFEGD